MNIDDGTFLFFGYVNRGKNALGNLGIGIGDWFVSI